MPWNTSPNSQNTLIHDYKRWWSSISFPKVRNLRKSYLNSFIRHSPNMIRLERGSCWWHLTLLTQSYLTCVIDGCIKKGVTHRFLLSFIRAFVRWTLILSSIIDSNISTYLTQWIIINLMKSLLIKWLNPQPFWSSARRIPPNPPWMNWAMMRYLSA